MASSVNYLAIILVVASTCFQMSAGTACYQNVCRECSDSSVSIPGREVRCDLRSLVSLTLLDAPDRPGVPNPPDLDLDFVCLKMTASKPEIVGDSTDVIRGCVLKIGAESMCNMLVGEEQARGKRDVRCVTCDSDLCNGAFGLSLAPAAIVMLIVAIFKTFTF